MKKGLYILGTTLFLISCGDSIKTETTDSANTLNEIKEKVEEVKTEFGAVKVDKSSAISTEDLLSKFEGKSELEATFKGEITEVCSKMGCWISVKNPVNNDENIMVIFKDHFTIPIDTKIGTSAYLHGIAKQDTVSIERQIHLLEDGGMSEENATKEVNSPKITMNFIADGISINTAE